MVNETSCLNVGGISRVCPASVASYSVPDDLPPAFRREWAFLPRNVYTMRDVMVGIPSGICVSGERVFLESLGNPYRWFMPSTPIGWPLPRSATTLTLEGPVTCIGSATYGHVLLQEVPRLLHALEEKPDLSVITWADAPKYVWDLLSLLEEKRVIRGSVIGLPRGLYRVADYAFTSDEDDSGFFRSESVQLLRRYVGQEAGITTGAIPPRQDRLYLSRRRSSRSFTNEADVEAMLSDRGFTVIYAEDLELGEEIALFQQAEMIVAPHGAGLCNLVWVKPSTRVVEIISPRMVSDFFVRLACIVQAEHALFWAQPDEGWGSVDLGSLALLVDRMNQTEPKAANDTVCH